MESPGTMTPASAHAEPLPLPFEQPPKVRACRRFLQGLQRMSSSPSLAKIGRIPPTSYRSGGKGSMSCVSLSSSALAHGHSYGNSYSSQSSAGFSTAPSSVASTPGSDPQFFDLRARIRVVGNESANHASMAPMSVALPADLRVGVKEVQPAATPEVSEAARDYFSRPAARIKPVSKRVNFDFWGELPHEIKVQILQFLKPKEIIRCSAVSKTWHKMCLDGQLWINVDTEKYYREIPSESLIKILTTAGPFIRDLNLRGCVQMKERWGSDGRKIFDACRNLENLSFEGCRIDRSSVHCFFLRNPRLVHINVSGLSALNNSAMKTIADRCPQLQHLNVSWCSNIDAKGLQHVVVACPKLRDLRAGELKGLGSKEFMHSLFLRNTLETLIVSHCEDLDDGSLAVLVQGMEPKIDPLTNRAMVHPRRFRHLDFSRCPALTDQGVQTLAHNVPDLCGLQLSHCDRLTDDALTDLLETTPLLTHLDLEELEELTNATLLNIAKSPCASNLQHLNISFCESLGDTGMLAVLKACIRIRSLVLDNTRVSDLVLAEAAAQLHMRDLSTPSPLSVVGLRLVVYDCQNVTWTGVREILSRNAEPQRGQVVALKCFHLYQDTVDEHTKRVLRGDVAAAKRLERKWAEFMVASEEAGAGGSRRRRRRLMEARMVHADEERGGPRAGRRRARSGGCLVM